MVPSFVAANVKSALKSAVLISFPDKLNSFLIILILQSDFTQWLYTVPLGIPGNFSLTGMFKYLDDVIATGLHLNVLCRT